MEAVPVTLHVPLSPPPTFPWVANVMVHQFGGRMHSQHSRDRELFDGRNVIAQPIKSRKRPAMLVLPEFIPEKVFSLEEREIENVEVAIQGREYCVFSKKGRRENMEDRYKVITDIPGDSNQIKMQAFFSVVDGHGGQAAADYVADNLGNHILSSLENLVEAADQHAVEQAIRGGYLEIDRGFLSQGVNSGACAVSVLVRNGEVHVANVGDCRVVLSRRGLATKLTNDHHLSREDERSRIENSGGFVQSCNGVWRLQGTLAVSRAIGDQHLKEWIISEPEIQKIPLTSDCDFLIMASDGLWDKVSEQEAVDVVSKEQDNAMESCKKLADISCSRGNKDDITVIVIHLQKYVVAAE